MHTSYNYDVQWHFEYQNTDGAKAILRRKIKIQCNKDLGSIIHPVSACIVVQIRVDKNTECAFKKLL